MGAANGFSEASWVVYTDYQEALEKLFCSLKLVNTTAKGMRKNCENSKAFCNGKNKIF
jgi:hypothetical protein